MDDSLKQPSNCLVLCELCTHPIETCSSLDQEIKCPQCNHVYKRRKKKDSSNTVSFALTALVLYVPANIFPFMTFEMYGQKNEANIWEGIVTLSHGNSWPLAVIVFIASMLVPFIKLTALFYLSLFGRNGKNQKFKTKLFRFVEIIGPWSMLDVFLLAVLVAIIKFGSMASVTPGLGSIMFLLVVIFTMLASASFDPKIIWENKNEKP